MGFNMHGNPSKDLFEPVHVKASVRAADYLYKTNLGHTSFYAGSQNVVLDFPDVIKMHANLFDDRLKTIYQSK